jgi:hypothetical protein
MAVDPANTIVGFQSLSKYGNLPAGWVDIATFARRSQHNAGVAALALPNMRGSETMPVAYHKFAETIRMTDDDRVDKDLAKKTNRYSAIIFVRRGLISRVES